LKTEYASTETSVLVIATCEVRHDPPAPWVTEGGARIPITDHETASHVGDDSQDDNGTPGNGSERSSEG